jgi:hypothetical protein
LETRPSQATSPWPGRAPEVIGQRHHRGSGECWGCAGNSTPVDPDERRDDQAAGQQHHHHRMSAGLVRQHRDRGPAPVPLRSAGVVDAVSPCRRCVSPHRRCGQSVPSMRSARVVVSRLVVDAVGAGGVDCPLESVWAGPFLGAAW